MYLDKHVLIKPDSFQVVLRLQPLNDGDQLKLTVSGGFHQRTNRHPDRLRLISGDGDESAVNEKIGRKRVADLLGGFALMVVHIVTCSACSKRE